MFFCTFGILKKDRIFDIKNQEKKPFIKIDVLNKKLLTNKIFYYNKNKKFLQKKSKKVEKMVKKSMRLAPGGDTSFFEKSTIFDHF